MKKIIKDHIKKLGEIEPVNEKYTLIDRKNALQSNFIYSNLPIELADFLTEYGGNRFNQFVKVTSIEEIPIASKGKISVEFILDVCGNTNSISNILDLLGSLLPENMLPFMTGASGDLICISLRKETFGEIYYWYHEGDEDDDLSLFLIDHDFEKFILRMEIQDDFDFGEDAVSFHLDPDF